MVDYIVNALHLLATVIWIGGMAYTAVVLMPAAQALDPGPRGQLMGAVAKRFSIVAWSSILLLLITGLIKTPAEMLLDTASTYGVVLTVKHALVLIMIIIGSVITFSVVPKTRSLAPAPGERPAPAFVKAQQQLKMLATTNLILGIIVLLCVVQLES